MSATTPLLRRLVVVVGATGVGKSKLGIELAKALNGEVVNTDAIQMYKGLNIASAKVTPEEAAEVPHHLFDFLEPSASFTVRDFRDRALPVIDDILRKGRTPILVGGTLYYVQALLWPSLLDDTPVIAKQLAQEQQAQDANGEKIDHVAAIRAEFATPEAMHAELERLDPRTAERFHPADDRKVLRNLQIIRETGELPSTLLQRQQDMRVTEQLRFHCNVLWLTCDQKKHDDRLSRRVDKMMKAGLLEEAKSFIKNFQLAEESAGAEAGAKLDGAIEDKAMDGIFQAIGYREFLPMFDPRFSRDDNGHDAARDECLRQCVANLKTKHRQYTRRQLKWIRRKLLTRNAPVFTLDTTNAEQDPDRWQADVFQPAMDISKFYLEGGALDADPPGQSRANVDGESPYRELRRHICEVCNVTVIGDAQFDAHLSSRSHRRKLGQSRKRKARDLKKEADLDAWSAFLAASKAEDGSNTAPDRTETPASRSEN